MSKKKILLSVFAALVAGFAVFAAPTVWLKPWSIDHFYARVFLGFALRHPMMLSQIRVLEPMGLDFHSDDLDDMSLEFTQREGAWTARQLDILRSYDREAMDEAGRLSYDILEFFLADLVKGERFMLHDYPVNPLHGIQTYLPQFMTTVHQINEARDAESYLERLRGFRQAFAQVIDGLELRREQGIVAPRFILDKVLVEMRDFTAPSPRENALFEHLAARLDALADLPAERRAELLTEGEEVMMTSVYPAYDALIQEVEQLVEVATDDAGVWKLPDGEAFYAYKLWENTTTDLSASEIHQLGLQQVAAIETEMRQSFAAVGLEAGTIGEGMAQLSADPRFKYPDDEAGRAALLDEYGRLIVEVDGKISQLFELLPKASVAVEGMPEFRQANAPLAYYEPPPFDGSKPGVFFVNLRSTDEHPRFSMRAVVYHEAIPGHHFQIALMQEMQDVPFFRRILPFIAYVEGWGLYAEQLAAEHGFQDDPYDRLGYLQGQMLRAVRLVVDTGLHHHRWTRQQAIDYMLALTGRAENEVVAEVERYIVEPGQACAYKVGQLKILELRRRARQALGERFDLRRFHNVILGQGAMPLTLLERQVEQWIDSEGSSG